LSFWLVSNFVTNINNVHHSFFRFGVYTFFHPVFCTGLFPKAEVRIPPGNNFAISRLKGEGEYTSE
jgi:hypothetical protein